MDIEMANHTVFNMDNDEHIIEDINGFWEANSESESESSLDDFEHKWSQKKNETSNTKLSFRKLKRKVQKQYDICLLYTSPSPRDRG